MTRKKGGGSKKGGKGSRDKIEGFAKIPDKLPIMVTENQTQIIFPTGGCFIKIALRVKEETSGFFRACETSRHLIFLPTVLGIGIARIGTLGDFRDFKKIDGGFSMAFRGLFRVFIPPDEKNPDENKITGSLQSAKWQALLETEISSFQKKIPQFKLALDELMFMFKKFRQRVFDVMPPEERRLFFRQEIVQETIKRVNKLSPDNLGLALDGIMMILGEINFNDANNQRELIKTTFTILSEEKIFNRLIYVIGLLYLVLGEGGSEFREESGEESDPELLAGEKTEESEEKKPLPAPNTSSIQEDLAKPRLIPERQTASKAESAPDSLPDLDWRAPSDFVGNIISFLDHYIIDQDRAKREIARSLQRLRFGFMDPRRPMVGGLFLGPTGVGKTESVKVLSKFLFGEFDGYTHIDCNALKEQQAGTAILMGAQPGYIGYDEEPRLSQWNLDKHHFLAGLDEGYKSAVRQLDLEIKDLERQLTRSRGRSSAGPQDALFKKMDQREKILNKFGYVPGRYLSILLFDEIERAHPNLYDILLKILDDGLLQLNNGEVTSFRLSLIYFTSNIHGREIVSALSGKGKIGIKTAGGPEETGERFKIKTWRAVVDAAERFFSFNPAFWGRIGKEKTVVFYPLSEEHYTRILEDILIADEFARDLQEKSGITLIVTERVKRYIVEESRDEENRGLGARPLRRIFENRIKDPIIMLLGKGEKDGLIKGDNVWVDFAPTEKHPDGEIIIRKLQRSSL